MVLIIMVAQPKVPLAVQVPITLKAALDNAADNAGKPFATFIREVLAAGINFKLTADMSGRSKKYATVEERIAAQKERANVKRDLVKKLLAEYAAGTLSLGDDEEG
jgi:predicted DNA-binding protein